MVQRNGPNYFKREERNCYICGKYGHIAKDCYHNKFANQNSFNRNGVGYRKGSNSPPRFGRTAQRFMSNGKGIGVNTGVNNNAGKKVSNNVQVNTGTSTNSAGTSTNSKGTSSNNTNPNLKKDENNVVQNINVDKKQSVKKSATPEKVSTGTSTNKTETSSNSNTAETGNSTYCFKSFDYINEKGQPKTTVAWVPKRN
jgi:hypothetical protein